MYHFLPKPEMSPTHKRHDRILSQQQAPLVGQVFSFYM